MFLLAFFCWLCLFNSILAHPLNQYKETDLQSGTWSGSADYPDLTRGLTDAEVRETLNDLTLDDLKSLDRLINEHITEREEANRACLRAQSKKNFRAAASSKDTGCREESECDEPKQVSRCESHKPKPTCPQTCPTTKRCMKTTAAACAPKATTTTRTTTAKPECAQKTTCGSSMDIFANCPKVNNGRKISTDDNKWKSDDFQAVSRKRMEEGKNFLQERDQPEDAAPARELAGIEKIAGNDQGEPLDERALHSDYPKEARVMEPTHLHDNLANREPEPLANLNINQGRHSSYKEHEHQSHFEQTNHNHQHETNINLKRGAKFGREQDVNLKQSPKANVHQDIYDNFKDDSFWGNTDPANWDDIEQSESDRMKLATWASLNPANLANIEDANWDLTNWAPEEQSHRPQFVQEHNFEMGKHAQFQPAPQEQNFEMGKHAHFQPAPQEQNLEMGKHAQFQPAPQEQNFEMGKHAHFQPAPQEQSFEMGKHAHFQPAPQEQQATFHNHNHNFNHHQAKLEQGNLGTSEHENRANLHLPNQESFEQQQTHQNRLVRDYHQANLNRDRPQQQNRVLRSEANIKPRGHQFSRKRNSEQQESQPFMPQKGRKESQAFMPQREQQESLAFIPHREHQTNVNYHPRQWSCNQQLTNQERLHKIEAEPAPRELYEAYQLSRKRNAEQERQSVRPQGRTYREQRSEVKYRPRSNQPLTNQANLKKMENEPLTLNPYERHQFYQKRNAKMERPCKKRRASVQEAEPQVVTKNNEPQPVNQNADLTKQQESQFDVDSFLANSARDPPVYMNSIHNDRFQRENVERRLNKDLSISESLNLDKLTGEKEASFTEDLEEWATDTKRGKRENRSNDDAPENSRETYLKKLMESFPRDQGSQINANVALQEGPFAHERMKRS